MTDLQKTIIEKIVKASKYIQDAYFKQTPFRFATKEEIKIVKGKTITLDLYPKLNVKNISGHYVDEDLFMKAINDVIELHKIIGATYFESPNDYYMDPNFNNTIGSIKKIYFDDATNSYKCIIEFLDKYKELYDYVNNDNSCLATCTMGESKKIDDITTNYPQKICKFMLYQRKEIDPALNALENTIKSYKDDVEWDDEKGTVKINKPLPVLKKDFYL